MAVGLEPVLVGAFVRRFPESFDVVLAYLMVTHGGIPSVVRYRVAVQKSGCSRASAVSLGG